MTRRREITAPGEPSEVMTRRPRTRRSSGPLRRILRQMFFSYGLWLFAAAVVLITAVVSEVPLFGAYSKGAYSAGEGLAEGAGAGVGAGRDGRPADETSGPATAAPTATLTPSTPTRRSTRTTAASSVQPTAAPTRVTLKADVTAVAPLTTRVGAVHHRRVHRRSSAARDRHRDARRLIRDVARALRP